MLTPIMRPILQPVLVPVDYEYGDGISVQQMLASGKIRAFYDILDVSTLSQDAAGTTPVTATGQPIGRVQDKSIYGKHATQITGTNRPVIPAAGYRLRSDFTDDVLDAPALGVDCDMYINTPYGWYKSQIHNTGWRLPLGDSTQIICANGLNAAQEAAIGRFFGTPRQFAVMVGNNTTVSNLVVYTGGGTTTMTFVGDNGVSVTKGLSADTNSSFDLTIDGLTAPVAVIWPESLVGNTQFSRFYCYTNSLTGAVPNLYGNTALYVFAYNNNQLTGSIPDLSNNSSLSLLYLANNQLTGSIPDLSNNLALTRLDCYVNKLTGSIPDLSNNLALNMFQFYGNKLTDYAGGTVSITLGSVYGHDTNTLTQSAIDALLAALVAANRISGTRVINLSGNNASPSLAGYADKATLVARGWTVTTN